MNAFDYIGKLTESPYYEFLLDTLRKLECSRKTRKKLERMESEIERYTGKHSRHLTPDYRGFYEFASREYLQLDELDPQAVDSRYQQFFDPDVTDFPDFVYLLCLYVKYHRDRLDFERTHPLQEGVTEPLSKADQATYIHLYNTQKLLISFFEKNESLTAVIVNSVNNCSTDYLDENLKELDPHEMKSRFLAAISLREKSKAFKLLGRLTDLDPGEEEYLEALAHFNNEEYRDAVRFASKVPSNALDYGAASALKLDCLANLGDPDPFLKAMDEAISHISNLWHVIYLFQRLLSVQRFPTMGAAEAFFTRLMDAMEPLSEKTNFMAKKGDQRYAGLVRQNIAKAALELYTMFEEASHYEEDTDLPNALAVRIAQLTMVVGLFVEPIPEFVTSFFEGDDTAESRKEELILFLLPFLIDNNPDKKFDNMSLALKSQYQLGFVEDFCENVIKNLKALSLYAGSGEEQAAQLICLAYLERIASGHMDDQSPDGLSLKEVAGQWMTGAEDLGNQVNDRIIMASLSPMGKLAYQAAEWQYIQTVDQDYGWKDAGMLSLAYFRIIELEMNQKLIYPLLNHLDVTALITSFDQRKAELREQGVSIRNQKNYDRKWSSLLPSFRDLASGDTAHSNGIMLGPLEVFLKNLTTNCDPEDPVAQEILAKLPEVLSDTGMNAFQNGELRSIIKAENRDMYRNPPAHTKYLSCEKACECRDFVRNTILDWQNWWK